MVDLPEKLWADRDPETNEKQWFSIEGMGVEYVHSDLYEQVKREKEGQEKLKRQYFRAAQYWQGKAEAAERLAGARVVTRSHVEAGKEAREIAAAARKLVRNTVDAIAVEDLVIRRILSALAEPAGEPITLTYRNWRGETAERTITPNRIWFGSTDWHPEPQWLLTAFDHDKQADRDFALKDFGAEPAGEAEPSQFLPTEDGEFNGNTFSDDPVPFGWITQSAYDRVNNSSLPEKVTIIRNAVGPTDMPRVALYTAPPDASAIREELDIPECVLSLCADKITLVFETSEEAKCAFDAIDAALAGAKP